MTNQSDFDFLMKLNIAWPLIPVGIERRDSFQAFTAPEPLAHDLIADGRD
jgi:hypothetical protein